jgi:hypothetical protein
MLSPKATNRVAPRAWGGVGIRLAGTDGVSWDAVPSTTAGVSVDGDVGVAVEHAGSVRAVTSGASKSPRLTRRTPVTARREEHIRLL